MSGNLRGQLGGLSLSEGDDGGQR